MSCNVCFAEAKYKCGACMQAKYCSKKCQQKDWFSLKHSDKCKIGSNIELYAKGSKITSFSGTKYVLEERLGKGTRSFVWLATSTTKGRKKGEYVVVKIFNVAKDTDSWLREIFMHRVFVEKLSREENTLDFCSANARCGTESFIDSDKSEGFLVTPLPAKRKLTMSLVNLIYENLKKYDENQFHRIVLPLAANICEDVARLHEARIVHRDLKPLNMIVDIGENEYENVLIDFDTTLTYDLRHIEFLDEKYEKGKLRGVWPLLSKEDKKLISKKKIPSFFNYALGVGTARYVDPALVEFDASVGFSLTEKETEQNLKWIDTYAVGVTLHELETKGNVVLRQKEKYKDLKKKEIIEKLLQWSPFQDLQLEEKEGSILGSTIRSMCNPDFKQRKSMRVYAQTIKQFVEDHLPKKRDQIIGDPLFQTFDKIVRSDFMHETFKLKQSLGEGAFGEVWSATAESSGKHFVAKIFRVDSPITSFQAEKGMVPPGRSEFIREVLIHRALADRSCLLRGNQLCNNAARCAEQSFLFDFEIDEEEDLKLGALLMPVPAKVFRTMDIYDFVSEELFKFPEEDREDIILTLAADICRNVALLHSARIVHRDLKLENMLVEMMEDDSFQSTLIDFNFARAYSFEDAEKNLELLTKNDSQMFLSGILDLLKRKILVRTRVRDEEGNVLEIIEDRVEASDSKVLSKKRLAGDEAPQMPSYFQRDRDVGTLLYMDPTFFKISGKTFSYSPSVPSQYLFRYTAEEMWRMIDGFAIGAVLYFLDVNFNVALDILKNDPPQSPDEEIAWIPDPKHAPNLEDVIELLTTPDLKNRISLEEAAQRISELQTQMVEAKCPKCPGGSDIIRLKRGWVFGERDEYILQKELPEGTNAKIWLAKTGKNQPVILKIYPLGPREAKLGAEKTRDPKFDNRREFIREVYMHRVLRSVPQPNFCENVVRCGVRSFLYAKKKFGVIVMPVAPNVQTMDLATFLKSDVTEKQKRHLAQHIISDVSRLHLANIVHRDLKPENILVDLVDEKIVRTALIDFNTAIAYPFSPKNLALLGQKDSESQKLNGTEELLEFTDNAVISDGRFPLWFKTAKLVTGNPKYMDPAFFQRSSSGVVKLKFLTDLPKSENEEQFPLQKMWKLNDTFAVGMVLATIFDVSLLTKKNRLQDPREVPLFDATKFGAQVVNSMLGDFKKRMELHKYLELLK